ncbi:sulfotransferase [Thalassospira sp. ER-Se-21-Dark]|uniref:sulfotransferase family protein n=1 Tax=Thalassospira sp. ER-Se-21-Dark TaxID=2585190 RepID=UPI001B3016C0|nr:sulfotransferase [Thalassospira sp. ER-Se-21-Dark]MBP3127064.1 sulfotransferase [Thalassospira sp. ER-Se-21-Dark]
MTNATAKQASNSNAFHVAGWDHWLSGLVSRHPQHWIRLGNFETRLAADAIEDIRIEKPIFIAGLARSGSTILLETLAGHADAATHRYRDYPPVFTPWLWNRFVDLAPGKKNVAVERTHADGINVTPESPEAFEEMIWMAFFNNLHEIGKSNVLDGHISNPAFEQFYRDHIRKLIHVRGGQRYVSKANYLVTRMEYLLSIFPDARFVLPVRDPVWHIASLIKQHKLFCAGEADNPRAIAHMQRVGHYEFGLDRRPINTGDLHETFAIMKLWTNGDEIEGWARYWSNLHHYLADRMIVNKDLAKATLVVRYEDLVADPAKQLASLFDHVELDDAQPLIDSVAPTIHAPDYYRPKFDDDEIALIRDITKIAAKRFGYDAVSV